MLRNHSLARLRSRTRLACERLEDRVTPVAAGNAFAHFAGTLAVAGEKDVIPLKLSTTDFNFRAGGILVGIAVNADASALDPAAPVVKSKSQRPPEVIRSNHNALDNGGFTIVRLVPGDFNVEITAQGGTTGAYTVDVFLAGDANGDFVVNTTDGNLIKSLIGKQFGGAGYDVDADVDRNGRIEQADVALASMNNTGGTSVRPLPVTLSLSQQDDPNGNNLVIDPDVTLVVQTRAKAKVSIDLDGDGDFDATATAPASGLVSFNTQVLYGTTTPKVQVKDSFGQVATDDLAVVRQDVVHAWNNILLGAVRQAGTNPPAASRFMAMVQTSVYDAVNAIIGSHEYYFVNAVAPLGSSPEAAAIAAAHRVLINIYPQFAANFNTQLTNWLAEIPDGTSKNDGVALGQSVADAIRAWRATDGFNAPHSYVPTNIPGRWRPTPPANAPALLPQWGNVTPWSMTSGSQFRAPAPPALDSAEYAAAVNEVKAIGVATGSTRTADQTEIARFWADGGFTETPPGHWNSIAQDVAQQENLDIAQNARLFALLDIVEADAAIASWDAKYAFDLWRPITAIREAASDGNAATEADPTWTPLIGTPPFPSYTSGHSTFSGGAAVVLAAFFGTDNIAFSTQSDGLPNVTRHFNSFSAASNEAALSRLYGGIHYSFDNSAGLVAGQAIAQQAAANLLNELP